MNHTDDNFNSKKMKWQGIGLTCIIITVFDLYFYFFRGASLSNSLLVWVIANIIAWGVITISFRRIDFIQDELNKNIAELKRIGLRDAEIAKLSANLAASLDETEVCQELVERLHSFQGYDYVAVFMLDTNSGNRILKAEVAENNLKPTPILKPGEGLSELPVLDGKLHYTPDISTSARHVPGLEAGSEIDVPVQFNDEILGVLVIESQENNAFSNEDFEILLLAADQAALALKNARLLKKEKSRRKQAEVLHQATATLVSAVELDEVLREILEQLQQVIEHDSACIFFWENEYVIAMAARGTPEIKKIVGQRFPAKNALFQLVLNNHKSVILNDVLEDPRFEGWGGTQGTASWMGIPLNSANSIIGYLTLDSYQPNAFDEEQAHLTQIFANQATIAIENAQLYQSTKETAQRQEVLHEISQEIIRTGMNLEQIYRAVHQAAARLMPADSFVISILDEKQNEIDAVYLWDKDKLHTPQKIPKGTGISWHVINTGNPIFSHDYFNQEEFQSLNVVHFGSEDHIRSVLAVPMRLGSKVVGMLSAQSYKSHYYKEEDQKILDMLAAYAAIAIDNARLFGKIQQLAITDSLTGVYNRRHFFEIANQEILRAQRYNHPISIIMLDLDHYKEINDTYGHDIGDEALSLIAKCCNENIRKTDVLARYGGDEFIILLPETNIHQSQEIAERLREFLETNAISIRDISLKTTISVGISGADDPIPELHSLLKCADIALYKAKEAGRNRVKIQTCAISQEYSHD